MHICQSAAWGLAALLLSAFLSAPLLAQECFDYHQPVVYTETEWVDLPSGVFGFTSMDPHGDYVSFGWYNHMDSYEGVFFARQLPDGQFDVLLDLHGSWSDNLRKGHGEGPLVTYRHARWDGAGGYTYENWVLDLEGEGTPRGELGHYGLTWICAEHALVKDPPVFRIYSLVDIENPAEVGQMPYPEGGVSDMQMHQGRLILVGIEDFIQVWDVDDMTSPQLLADQSLRCDAGALDWGPDFLLVSAYQDGFYKVDLSNPDQPVIPAGPMFDYGYGGGFALKDPMVYVNTFANEIKVFDLSADPIQFLPGAVEMYDGDSLKVWNNTLYWLYDSAVKVVPLDCGNITPNQKKSLGGFKSMFR